MFGEGQVVFNLLVVDRDADDRRALQVALGARGLDTVGCGSVADALALGDEGVDAVVVHAAEPDPAGLSVCRYIAEGWPETPVVVVSEGGALGKAAEAFGAGAYDFVSGPIDRMAVSDALEHAAHVGRARKVMAQTEPSATPLESLIDDFPQPDEPAGRAS